MFHSYTFLRGDENKLLMHLIGNRLQPGTDKFCIMIRYRQVPLKDLLTNHTSDLLVGKNMFDTSVSRYLIDRTQLFSPVEGPIELSRLLKHAGVPAGSDVLRSLIRDIVAYARFMVVRVEGREEPEDGKVYQPVLPIVLEIVEGRCNNGEDHATPPPPYSGQLRWRNGIRRRIIRFY